MILTKYGSKVRFYDEHPFSDGKLYAYSESHGLVGIVRARSWEDAYEVVEDEFMHEASETVEELVKEYGYEIRYERGADGSFRRIKIPNQDAWPENEIFLEGYGFRPNGPNERDVIKHGIYSRDLNGESLVEMDLEMAAERFEFSKFDIPNIDADPSEDYDDDKDDEDEIESEETNDD